MEFHIEKLILWPINKANEIHTLPFEDGVVNVVHGRSRTGKSSIISIIDYCLGAGRCTIPVGKIRDSVAWYGLQINIKGRSFIVARKTPGTGLTSKEFYLRPFEDVIPTDLVSTHKEDKFKHAFNNLVRLTNLTLNHGEEVGQHDGRPSYRDLAAFNFLPQHIVANPNTLFYKADTYDHRERLKKVLPLALGIVSSEHLAKERERARLQRLRDDLAKQLEVKKRSMASWDAEVDLLWGVSVELGLTEESSVNNVANRLQTLRNINDLYAAGKLTSILRVPSYQYTNQKYKEIKEEEETLQAKVDDLRREIRTYENLARRGKEFSTAVKDERNSVVNLGWLKSRIGSENHCVVCGSASNQLQGVINNLEVQVEKVKALSDVMFESPIVDKEVETSKQKLSQQQELLHKARTTRMQLEKLEEGSKDSLSKVYVLLGRIQALLMGISVIENSDELSQKIAGIDLDILELDKYLQESDKKIREEQVDKRISGLIWKYANGFELENRGFIKLDKNELTLCFDKSPDNKKDSKKEYLWEVGSGANWMGYHIATFLALHQFLVEGPEQSSPVFSFLVIDQPSQVYFPSANSGANELDVEGEKFKQLISDRDDDVRATKKIFEMLTRGLRDAKHRYQIIVLEHADQSIWGNFSGINEVANWKPKGTGLIPAWWN
ncbi:MAG TPA: DUF3732 domain-containing protein [Oxalobacteraceae bacterium]|nr:DUF3732 domain-containing protein [Oxalobacteraceae bacterium]